MLPFSEIPRRNTLHAGEKLGEGGNYYQQALDFYPIFLLACLVAEECDNNKSNVKKFPNTIFGSKKGVYMQDKPQIRVGLINEKGKVWWMFINLSICSTALGIIDILNDTYAKIKVEKDENGNQTGNVEIV